MNPLRMPACLSVEALLLRRLVVRALIATTVLPTMPMTPIAAGRQPSLRRSGSAGGPVLLAPLTPDLLIALQSGAAGQTERSKSP